MRTRSVTCTAVLLSLLLAGCANRHAASPLAPIPTAGPLAPVSTNSPTTVGTSAPSTTASSAVTPTTPPSISPGVTVAATELLPSNVGTKVDAAPGVTTPGDIRELLPKLWAFVPSAPDPNDAHVQPPLPGDVEILAAYLETIGAVYEQVTQRPTPATPSPRVAESFVDGGAEWATGVFAPRAASGQYRDLGQGLVVRPIVIADPRSATEAFIFDCQLDGTVLRNADGSLADGEVEGVKNGPQIARIVKVNGHWITDKISADDRVCA
jgi:hypothetical protein